MGTRCCQASNSYPFHLVAHEGSEVIEALLDGRVGAVELERRLACALRLLSVRLLLNAQRRRSLRQRCCRLRRGIWCGLWEKWNSELPEGTSSKAILALACTDHTSLPSSGSTSDIQRQHTDLKIWRSKDHALFASTSLLHARV